MTTEDIDIGRISGNAPDDVKAVVADTSVFFVLARNIEGVNGPIFGEAITKRLVVTEVSVDKKIEEPSRMEGRVVCELTVEDGEETPSLCVNDVAYGWGESTDMVNGGGKIHGGCSAFLIDVCSSMALMALKLSDSGEVYRSVSQSLNIVYHSPAGLGDKLRIVNTTMTIGARAHSARTEIWNATHRRLVSSGVHIKMQASEPKANL